MFRFLILLLAIAFPALAQRVYLPDPDSRPIEPALDAEIAHPHILAAADGNYYNSSVPHTPRAFPGNATPLPHDQAQAPASIAKTPLKS